MTARQQCYRLAEEYDLDIDDDRRLHGIIWVYPTPGLYPDDSDIHYGSDSRDPYLGNHCVDSWRQALEICETYAAAIERERRWQT
jgi:hypothetical protein